MYRRRISIENASSTTLPAGFTIRVPLGTALVALLADGKVRADFSDLRVVGDGALGERDRIVDPPTGPAPAAISFSLAVPIASGETSDDYALYYGDPDASAAPANGTAVFALYDDFATTISAAWQQNDTPTVVNGQLVLGANNTDAVRTSAAADAVPIVSAVELIASVADPSSAPTSQPEGTFWYWFGYQRETDFTATDPWVLWIARGTNAVRAEQKSPVGCEDGCAGTDRAQNSSAHYYAIERDPTATRFYLDGALVTTIGVNNTVDYAVMARNYMAASDVRIDYIRARARVSPDPVVALGSEESF